MSTELPEWRDDEPTTITGRAVYSMGPAFIAGQTFTWLAESIREIEAEAAEPFRTLVESIKWVPMAAEDDDEPAEFAVADPDAYREARALLKTVLEHTHPESEICTTFCPRNPKFSRGTNP